MSDPYSTVSVFPLIIQLLDFFGTMAFAASGAFKAIEKKSDIVGVIILSIITGLAGGIIRDVIFGRSPPIGIANPAYLLISISTGATIFLLYPRLKKHWNLFLKFDAIGLGVFTIIGATTAYTLFGLNFLIIAFAGVLTAIGGGVLRDVFVNEIPIVFVKELYVTASFTGITVFYLLLILLDPIIAAIIGATASTSVRLLAIKHGWNLPRPRD